MESTPLLIPQGRYVPSALTMAQRREKNRRKRLKLHSKRLRRHWQRIVSFLDLKSAVAFTSTCRRLLAVQHDGNMWQMQYEYFRQQNLTRLLCPHEAITVEQITESSAKQQLRQLVHARYLLDPTNALQLRLREAERAVFHISEWNRHVQSLCQFNLPFLLLLCGASLWAYYDEQMKESSASLSSKTPTTFLVALDAMTLVAVLFPSYGIISDKVLHTVAVVAAVQVGAVIYVVLGPRPVPQKVHAIMVVILLLGNVIGIRVMRRRYARRLEMFKPSY